jgi:hypothetical protein
LKNRNAVFPEACMVDLNPIVKLLFQQSVTAGVLFIVLLLFARWCKNQIQDLRRDHSEALSAERADKARCFELHETTRKTMNDAINNNTAALRDLQFELGKRRG